jgi:hypothetical protein
MSMAADDDDRKPEPDPWADIVADGIDGDEESSFQFDAEPAAVSPPDDIPAVADESTAAAASDELVDACTRRWRSSLPKTRLPARAASTSAPGSPASTAIRRGGPSRSRRKSPPRHGARSRSTPPATPAKR